MPYKDPEKSRERAKRYWTIWYAHNKEKKKKYDQSHRKELRINWRKYWENKKKEKFEKERKRAIVFGTAYRSRRSHLD